MTSSTGRTAAPEQGYTPADAEIGWRIANPIMCTLIGLIAGGWKGALIGLACGTALIASPYVLAPLAGAARATIAWAAARCAAGLRDLEHRSPRLRRLMRGRP